MVRPSTLLPRWGLMFWGDVGRDLESAAAGDEVAGVVVLIGTQREPALAMPPAQAVEHLEPCLAFGGSCRLGEQDVDREAVLVLHQKGTGEVGIGRGSCRGRGEI